MKLTTRFGDFGGIFVPENLVEPLIELESYFVKYKDDKEFLEDLSYLLKNYAGRPTPLYKCANTNFKNGSQIFLKREDLLHGGAHKTNQVIAQCLLTKKMGKKRIIAETGAGQHGVACALVGARFGFDTTVYMGAKDIERQQPNVMRMRLLGANVISVKSGEQTLKDAVNEALRDWAYSFANTHYVIGSIVGPHPFPTIVREFQRIIGKECLDQFKHYESSLPDYVIACVGGGSNCIGIFYDFLPYENVHLIGVEGGGSKDDESKNAKTLQSGSLGIIHGACTKVMQDENGQILESHSISAGLDYPAVGPEHCYLQASNKATYVAATDEEALSAFLRLSKTEGIIPALESSHALAYAYKLAESSDKKLNIVVNLSGRGDKDLAAVLPLLDKNLPNIKEIGVLKNNS